MDSFLLLGLNKISGISAFIDAGIMFTAVILPYIFLAATIWFLASRKSMKGKMYAFSVVLLSTLIARGVITETVRYLYNRPRPFEVFEGINQVVSHMPGGSFPSGHMTFYAAIAGAIFFFNKFSAPREYSGSSINGAYRFKNDTWSIWLFSLTILIGLARVAGGIHWPSDVVGGILIGIASAWFAALLVLRRKKEAY